MNKLLLALFMAVTALQANAQCWEKVISGPAASAGIKSDGTLWVWGGTALLLGDNYQYSVKPTQVGTDNNWTLAALGVGYCLALKTDGTLWSWGDNGDGLLGDGTKTSRTIPAQVGNEANWAAIACGNSHNLALKTNGTLWGWGENSDGALGGGTKTKSYVPKQIGTDSDWQFIEAGHHNSAAIKKDGTLWMWGLNDHGQLGSGTLSNIAVPTQTGTDTNWKSVVLGYLYTGALKTDATLWTWGYNSNGQLGNGTHTEVHIPTSTSTGQWASISAAEAYYSMGGIKEDGSLWTWGDNETGVLGNNTLADSAVPLQIPSDVGWAAYSVEVGHSAALKADGSLWVWGANQLHLTPKDNPVLTPWQVQPPCTTASLEQTDLQSIRIYPNPATGVLNIDNPAGIAITGLIVYDITGKTIMTQNGNSQINVQQLPAGLYVLKAVTNSGTATYTFIKQ